MASRRSALLALAIVLLLAAAVNVTVFVSSDFTQQRIASSGAAPRDNMKSGAVTSAATISGEDFSIEPLMDRDVRRPSGVICGDTMVPLSAARVGGPSSVPQELQQPSPACDCVRPVTNDVDYGKTLSHIMKRHYCLQKQQHLHGNGSIMRIVQVGANTGDNANDHLVTFLKLGIAQGVLLEPVPWIFRRLTQTYQHHGKTVRLVNAAMSPDDGNVSFTAPKEHTSGWLPQMGGLSLPPRTVKSLSKKGGLKMFDRITVHSIRFDTLLSEIGWSATPPDVFVVDAEGYDAVIVSMVLDTVERQFGGDARIPIIQFEWKHVDATVRSELWSRLIRLGYCVMQVHYDDIAVHRLAAALRTTNSDGDAPHEKDGKDRCGLSFVVR